jgi:predicted nucleic-acid-binding Zn-ribbon protein
VKYVTEDLFDRFAEAKGIHLESCPACRKDVTWRLDRAAAGIPYVHDSEILASGLATEVVKIHCSNCGYLLLFDKETILEWEKSRG